MEKQNRDLSEKSFGESESMSSQSEKESDITPEITMEFHDDEKQTSGNEDLKDSIRALTEKLSAALANVSAKDDLVKQHVKVAEEAVAGWEKAENEVIELQKKLEVADDKNRILEDRVSHLDGALKECVRQLRQAKDEQEQIIQESVIKKTQELQSCKTNLENQILEAVSKTEELSEMAESVAKENVMLRHELLTQCEELEIRTIERDLSTQAAETASKQSLDSIKKVAKLEAECRKLRMVTKSSVNDHRSTDSDGGERMDMSCSESWGSSTLIEKRSSAIEIDLMDDFLEMERLVAEKPDENRQNITESVTEETVAVLTCRNKELAEKLEKLETEKDELESEVKAMVYDKMELESKLQKLEDEKDELESDKEVIRTLRLELEAMVCHKMELESKLQKLEAEKDELESDKEVIRTLRFELEAMVYEKMEVKSKLKKLEDELEAMESKLEKMEIEKAEMEISYDIMKEKYEESQDCLQEIESRMESMKVEEKIKSGKIESLEEDLRKERFGFNEVRRKCEVLEDEVSILQEIAIKREIIEPKIKQEDMETAAVKLANCQKTIASLGKQLQSLATLEDFLIDSTTFPFSHKNQTFIPRNHPQFIKETSLSSSDSSASDPVLSNRGSSEKNRNGFAKVFTRSKDGIHLVI